MPFGLDLSTLGNLGRTASRAVQQNTEFEERQRLLGEEDADRQAARALMKAAVDPTPENIQQAQAALGGASTELSTKAIPLLQGLSQLPRRAEAENTRRQTLADRSQLDLRRQAQQGADVDLDTLLQPRREAFAGVDPATPDVSMPQAGKGFTLSPGQRRFGPDGTPVAANPKDPDPEAPKWVWDGTRGVFVNPATQEVRPLSNPEVLRKPDENKLSAGAKSKIAQAEEMRGMAGQLVGMLQNPDTAQVLERFMGGTVGKAWNRATALEGGVGLGHMLANAVLPGSREFKAKPGELVAFETLLKNLKDTFGRVRTGMRIAEDEYVVFDAIVGTLDMAPEVVEQKLLQLSDQLTRAIKVIEEGGGGSGGGGGPEGSVSIDIQAMERRAKAGDMSALDELEKAAAGSDEALEAYERVLLGR